MADIARSGVGGKMKAGERKQLDIELILMRQLAASLYLPVFIVDPDANLVFYNEAAEEILGRRFEERGAVPAEEWGRIFRPTDGLGTPVSVADLPLVSTTSTGRPSHRPFWIEGLDGVRRRIEVTAFPLIGQHKQIVGGVALFWEDEAS
jgi:PAS domain-containing protein